MTEKTPGGARHSGDLIASLSGRNPARNRHADVLWALGFGIVSGRYGRGTILPSDAALLEEFKVSRTVLREALKTLAAKGLIEPRARVGTRVLPPNRWNLFDVDVLAWHFELGPDIGFLEHLAEMRIGIEVEAAALAAVRATPEHVAALEKSLGGMACATTPFDFARHDLDFHKTLAEASGNPFMASIGALVEMALTAAFTFSSPVNEAQALSESVAVHRRIVEAVASGDAEKARAAMKETIAQGFARAATDMAGKQTNPQSGSSPSG